MRKVCTLSIALVATLCQGSPAHSVAPLILHNVTIIDTEAGRATGRMSVTIERERITRVSATMRPLKSAVVFDASGLYVIPGLWDMHVHAFWTDSNPARMFPLFLANGVTGIRDMGSPLDLERLHRLRAEYEQKPDSPRIVLAGKIIDGNPPVWPGSLAVSDGYDAAHALRILKAAGADLAKVYSRLSRKAYDDVALAGKRARLPVAGHIPITVPALAAAAAGQHTVEHLSELLLACSRDEELLRGALLAAPPGKERDAIRRTQVRRLVETFDRRKALALGHQFRRHGTWQVPTLLVQRTYSYPPMLGFKAEPWSRHLPPATLDGFTSRLAGFRSGKTVEELEWQRRSYDMETELVRIMRDAGVGFLVGTDADLFYPAGFGVHRELELLVDAGLSAAEALRAATLNPARSLGRTHLYGSVKPGRMADLLLLEANPLIGISNTRRIRAVILKGRIFPREQLNAMLEAGSARRD